MCQWATGARASRTALTTTLTFMQIRLCNFADERELRAVHLLQRAAYSIEAELIGCREIPGLQESVAELARSRETFGGCFVVEPEVRQQQCVGIIATEPEAIPGEAGDWLRISRLAVDPAHFRRGIAARLVRHALSLHQSGRGPVIVSTGAANMPGRQLYESLGFVLHHEFLVLGGLRLVEYRWNPPGCRD